VKTWFFKDVKQTNDIYIYMKLNFYPKKLQHIYMCMYINICNTKVNDYNTLKCVCVYKL